MVVEEKIEIDIAQDSRVGEGDDLSSLTVGELREILAEYSEDMVIADVSTVYQISADRLRIV